MPTCKEVTRYTMSSLTGVKRQYMHKTRMLVSCFCCRVHCVEFWAVQLLTAGRSAVMVRLTFDGQSSRLQK